MDLGATSPCEQFLTAEAAEAPELTYPLHVRVCNRCLLAQLPPLITPEDNRPWMLWEQDEVDPDPDFDRDPLQAEFAAMQGELVER